MCVSFSCLERIIIMITISLCMIVKNEEENLAVCLDSAKNVFDEIIIVDTGSSDKTVEIAKKYTDKIYFFDWVDDFSAARNYSFSKATCNYCMWLDADDILTSESAKKIKKLKKDLSSETDIVMLPYNIAFDEFGNPTFSYYRERIIRNSLNYRWHGRVHEAITPIGNVFYFDAYVTHKKNKISDPNRNLRIYEKMLIDKIDFTPRDSFYYGRELYYHQRYDDAIPVLYNLLKNNQAWTENKIDSCIILSECYLKKDDIISALSSLFHSFLFDGPRAEICCRIGEIMVENKNYCDAAFWFETAMSDKTDLKSGAFTNPDYRGFIPAIWLCVCYDNLGKKEKAKEYNEIALSFKPQSEAALSNKKYFEQGE